MTDVLDREQLVTRLEPWLSDRLGGAVSITAINTPVGNGFSAETLLLDLADADGPIEGCVIRFANPLNNSLFLDAAIGSQYRVVAALAEEAAVPSPSPVGVDETGSVLGTPMMVTRRIGGRAPSQVPNYNAVGWVADMSPAERGAMWESAIAAMAALHSVDWRPRFGFLLGDDETQDCLSAMLGHARTWFDWAARGREHPYIEAALERLWKERPGDARESLLWGDASITNMLFVDGKVSAILDWEIATLGPPEADLAWWLYFQGLLSGGLGHVLLPGIPGRDETLTIYGAASGVPVRNFAYYELLSTTRNAIMSTRSVNRQVAQGMIPMTTLAVTDNPSSVQLAIQLGMTPPTVGTDFADYVAAASRHRR